MKISAIIITRNEEKNIKECIDSLGFVDELVVVDNNSSDKTAEIAKKNGAKIYRVGGLDFSYLRNIGKEKAQGEWLFYIDTDERVTDSLAEEIVKRIPEDKETSAYSLVRKNYYLGSVWPKKETMIRLIKKESLIGWQGILHETPQVVGKIGSLRSNLLHFTHKDFASMLEKTNEWSEIESQLLYKSNHPQMSTWRFFRMLFTSFWRSFVYEKGWQAGSIGWLESIYQAFSTFITYAKLWEKQNKEKLNNKMVRSMNVEDL